MITNDIKQLVRDLDPIVGHDVYLCDCGSTEDCPPELTEVTVGDLYDVYGFSHENIGQSPWGEEVHRLWEAVGEIVDQLSRTVQFQLVDPAALVGQGTLWGDE